METRIRIDYPIDSFITEESTLEVTTKLSKLGIDCEVYLEGVFSRKYVMFLPEDIQPIGLVQLGAIIGGIHTRGL